MTALGAISTSHHLATEAGARVIKAGGNAIDAALTAAAALCVVYPNNVALGGDMVAIVRSPDGRVRFLNGTGPAAKAETLEGLRARHGSALPLRGIDTVTVPGGVCAWNQLHELGASRPWAEHFDDAITFAADGVPVASSVAATVHSEGDKLANDRGWRDVFMPGGTPLNEGDLLKQPALAETLRRVAVGGSAEFYEGDTALAWIAGLQRLGSNISLTDSIDYLAHWDEPLEADYLGHRVFTGAPNTSGFMLLRALLTVSGGIADPLSSGAGELARVFAASNAVRRAYLADPRMGGRNGTDLISAHAPETTFEEEHPTGDTVGFSVATADGWAVSFINSVYYGFGAGILEPDTGIIFQNRGTAFSLDPTSPNAFAPGKRPRHTLTPVMVTRDGAARWVPSTMGGSAQPQIHTHLLLRVMNGASPTEATHSPRWTVADDGETVLCEADVSVTAQRSLEEAGFNLVIVPPRTERLGHSNLIEVFDGGYDAASDPRSNGSAMIIHS